MTAHRLVTPARALALVLALVGSLLALVASPAQAATSGGLMVTLRSTDNGFSFQPWALNADGTGLRRVTAQSAISQPALSADGKKLAFAGPVGNDDSLGRYAVFTINTDGSGLRQVTSAGMGELDPAWSADGAFLLFTRDTNGRLTRDCCSVYEAAADGSQLHAIPNTGSGRQPSFSPDGRSVVFVAPGGLFQVGIDGSARRELAAGSFSDPVYSPDGRSVAVTLEGSPAQSDLGLVTVATGAVSVPATTGGRIESPQWDGNGSIYYIQTAGQGYLGRVGSVVRRVAAAGGTAVTTAAPPGEIVDLAFAANRSPFGSLDAADRGPGTLRVAGWAIDPTLSGPATVDVTLDGAVVASVTANGNRPDVGQAYPQYGSAHGYITTVVLPGGDHTACVLARATGSAPSTTLGCRTISGRPFGSLDVVDRGPGTVSVGGWAIDPSTAGPATVDVTLDGAILTSGSAGSSRSDIGRKYPAYGPDHGFNLSAQLPSGDHTLCVVARGSSGSPATTLGCRAVSGRPVGVLDQLVRVPGGVRVSGYALDPDTTGAIQVVVASDGQAVRTVTASGSRPDAAMAYPAYGAAHGYSADVALTDGTAHTLCATANDATTGPTTALGCRSITPSDLPFGSLDVVAPGPGGFRVGGWALDPDTGGPVTLHAYVDGRLVSSLGAAAYRSDIARLYPGYGGGHGFNAVVPTSGGQHQVCLYLINSNGVNPLLGCRTVTRGVNPVGSLDVARRVTGGISVAGWALDPDTDAPLRVDFYVDGRGITSYTASGSRPDVARAFPGWSAAHGFSGVLPTTGSQVCAYAINQGAGHNQLIRCAAVSG